MFFHFGKKAIYKFGASNKQIQHVRPNNLVMWEALKWYHDRGFHTMNLGRSELSNPGLRRYKRTWGGRETQIKYFRYDLGKRVFLHKDADRMADVGKIFMKIPTPLLRILGFLFYRHAG
jgi:lipid II:glycine glycyltransferase (peptidoglycan interpeptide bridge formation enzyme)